MTEINSVWIDEAPAVMTTWPRPMQVVTGKPPIFDEIVAVFPLAARGGVIFSWGDRIYNPGGGAIPPHLMVHEGVHGRRQGTDEVSINLWWSKYLWDDEFRLQEEIHAHCGELGALTAGANRNLRRAALKTTADRLAAPLYGYRHLMTPTKARTLLRAVMAEAA